MSLLKDIVLKGKILKPDLKQERSVSYITLFGLLLLLFWMLVLFPKVFVDVKLILLLLLAPGLLLTPFFYKKLFEISGYAFPIKSNWKYNSILTFLAYCLVTIPVGNTIVASILLSNSLFAQQETKTIIVQPSHISESSSRRNSDYSHIDVTFDGVQKQINFGKTPVDSIAGKSLSMTISKGLFGYYIIRKRTLISGVMQR